MLQYHTIGYSSIKVFSIVAVETITVDSANNVICCGYMVPPPQAIYILCDDGGGCGLVVPLL